MSVVPDACWLWTGARNGKYGSFRLPGLGPTASPAHRVAYILTYGEVPPNRKVIQMCGHKLCVRPDHLTLKILAAEGVDTREERFWEKVVKLPDPPGCWLWTGATMRSGHGIISKGANGTELAHRYSWALHFKQPIPHGAILCHNCPNEDGSPGGDNPACVNPFHLLLGKREYNQWDMQRKGRAARGEKQPHAKLTADAVLDLRRWVGRLLEADQEFVAMAAALDVSPRYLSDVALGRRWKHVVDVQQDLTPV